MNQNGSKRIQSKANQIKLNGYRNWIEPNQIKFNPFFCVVIVVSGCCNRSIECVIECTYYCIFRQIYSLQSCHNCCVAHPSLATAQNRVVERQGSGDAAKEKKSWHHLTPLYPVSRYVCIGCDTHTHAHTKKMFSRWMRTLNIIAMTMLFQHTLFSIWIEWFLILLFCLFLYGYVCVCVCKCGCWVNESEYFLFLPSGKKESHIHTHRDRKWERESVCASLFFSCTQH